MTTIIIWLIILAIAFFILELFIPSGGILGLCSLFCIIACIIFMYQVSTTLGNTGLIVALLGIPIFMLLGIKLLPSTPFFKMLSLKGNQPANSVIYDKNRDTDPQSLVGLEGVTLTDLRPVGTCLINNNRMECTSNHGVIPNNTKIKITSVSGLDVKVEPIS